MPDDQNTTQNQDSEENSIPLSPQEPMEPISQDIRVSEPSNMPPEAPESPINADNTVPVNNANTENEPISTPSPEKASPTESVETLVNPASNEVNEPPVEPVSEPVQASKPSTAQIPVNEPLSPEPEPIKAEPIPVPQSQPVSTPIFVAPQQDKISLARELLNKAKNAIQFRKRKKLEKIMTLFLKKSKITNDEEEKFLHVSDATATRYLSILEKENKIKQTGKTGHAVSYTRI